MTIHGVIDMSKYSVKNMQGVPAHIEYIRSNPDKDKYLQTYYDLSYNPKGIKPIPKDCCHDKSHQSLSKNLYDLIEEKPRKMAYEIPRNKEIHLRKNQKVYHKTYGEGILKEICAHAPEPYIVVDFNGSSKLLLLKHITENELLKPYKFNFNK